MRYFCCYLRIWFQNLKFLPLKGWRSHKVLLQDFENFYLDFFHSKIRYWGFFCNTLIFSFLNFPFKDLRLTSNFSKIWNLYLKLFIQGFEIEKWVFFKGLRYSSQNVAWLCPATHFKHIYVYIYILEIGLAFWILQLIKRKQKLNFEIALRNLPVQSQSLTKHVPKKNFEVLIFKFDKSLQ